MHHIPLQFQQESQITNKLQKLYADLNSAEFKGSARPYSEIKLACPELDEQLQNYGLDVIESWLFQTFPASEWQDNGTIHIDLDRHENPNIVLNWPIFNCLNTYMNFWQVNDQVSGNMAFTPIFQKDYRTFKKEECNLIDQLELTSPHLINVAIPHNVSTRVEAYRLIMSFRFKTNPLHLWR
jgi:hypothetical protein